MRCKTALIAFVATTLLGLVTANAAEPDWQKPNSYDYACKIVLRGPGWTPRESFFTLYEDKKQALVLDPVIFHSVGKPVMAKIARSQPDLIRLRWRVNVPADDGMLVPVGYRVDFNPQAMTGKIYLSIRSNAGAITPGTLTCKRQ